ncbi:MAG: hypothetical protein IJ297_07915 [Clostridia bacterium]|nr:hypothetical protein [Clostridia bacterium]
MKYEKNLKIIKNGYEEEYVYYVKECYSEEFKCQMYNVGIKSAYRKKEIDSFSPSREEAERLCDYLYDKNVDIESLFLMAEEFIVTG